MSPTLNAGDRVLIRRGSRELRTGAIVVVTRPEFGVGWANRPPVRRGTTVSGWYIKRAVAVAHDRYPPPVDREGTVPADHIVIIGDNPRSMDSKQLGPCPCDQILGVVIRRLQRPGSMKVASDR